MEKEDVVNNSVCWVWLRNIKVGEKAVPQGIRGVKNVSTVKKIIGNSYKLIIKWLTEMIEENNYFLLSFFIRTRPFRSKRLLKRNCAYEKLSSSFVCFKNAANPCTFFKI